MRVIACGDRHWQNENLILYIFHRMPLTTVIHGGCRGADEAAGRVAAKLGLEVIVHKASWDTYGGAAGPIRNEKMLTEEPDLVIAFHSILSRSKGTKDMVMRAITADIPVLIFPDAPVKAMNLAAELVGR